MIDDRLLSFLCDWLRERRNKIATRLSVLKKEHNIEPEDINIIKRIAEKERELALITKEKITEYQSYWISLSKHSRRPCPLCFIHGETSYLTALPEESNEEPFKCENCKNKFFLPLDKD